MFDNQTALSSICQRYHITKLALFGSILRGDFEEDSDVDVLVEFEQGHTPDFLCFTILNRHYQPCLMVEK